MGIQRRALVFATVGLAVWASVSTLTAAYYYSQYAETRRNFEELRSLVINVNVMIDDGNGNPEWHNTTVIAGSTAFDALLQVASVEYKLYSFGAYVTSINGVSENLVSKLSWYWYWWNATSSGWDMGLVGCDTYTLEPNDSIKWSYEG